MFGKEIEIPEEWEVRKVKEIARVKGGKRLPKGESFSKTKTKHPYLRVIDFRNNNIDDKNLEYISDEIFKKIKNYAISSNDVYLSIAGTIGLTGLIPDHLDGSNLTENAAKITNLKNITKKSLSIILNSKIVQDQIRSHLGTTTQPKLALFRIEKLSLPLPPIHEQQRIASILSGVDAMIESTQQVVNKAERLKNGLMQKLLTRGIGHTKFKRVPWMFGREIEIPEEWKINQISKVFEYLKTGTNPRNDLREHGGVMYIHYGDIHTKWDMVLDCNYSEIPFINKEKVGYLSLLKDGDLIVVDASEDHEGSGTSVVVKNVSKKMVSGLHTIALRDNNQNTQVDFRAYITSIRFVKTQIIASVTGISVYGLSKKKLGKIKIPIPSLPEQQKIASILSGVDASSYVQLIINARPYIIPTILLILFTATLRHEFYNTEKNIHSYHNS